MIVTGEIIKSAISLKIKNSFASGDPVQYPKIYKEPVVQGFVKPSFHIKTLDVDQKRISKLSYERLYQMNIRYHIDPKTDKLIEVLEGVGNSLMGVLNSIDVPIVDPGNVDTTRPVTSILMEYKVVENVLQFFVNYRIKVTPVLAEQPLMNTLTINKTQKEA